MILLVLLQDNIIRIIIILKSCTVYSKRAIQSHYINIYTNNNYRAKYCSIVRCEDMS